MSDYTYELGKPLVVEFTSSSGASGMIDIAVADAELSRIQADGLDDWADIAEQFLPWMAQAMGVGVDQLTTAEAIECCKAVSEGNYMLIEEAKKKRSAMLSSLFSTPESHPTTGDGPTEKKTHGSTTPKPVALGETESGG